MSFGLWLKVFALEIIPHIFFYIWPIKVRFYTLWIGRQLSHCYSNHIVLFLFSYWSIHFICYSSCISHRISYLHEDHLSCICTFSHNCSLTMMVLNSLIYMYVKVLSFKCYHLSLKLSKYSMAKFIFVSTDSCSNILLLQFLYFYIVIYPLEKRNFYFKSLLVIYSPFNHCRYLSVLMSRICLCLIYLQYNTYEFNRYGIVIDLYFISSYF